MKRSFKAQNDAIISLKEEFVLRDAFGQESVRKEFISDVTGIPIGKIRSVELTSGFLRRGRRRKKQGILDFVMTMNDEAKIDVELQLRAQRFWKKRSLFYLAKLYVEDLYAGENYEKLKKCISISILDFILLDDREDNHSVFTLKDDRGREFTDLFEIHVIEMKKALSGNDGIDKWIRLFQAETRKDLEALDGCGGEGFRKAVETVKTMSLGKNLRWYFERQQKARRDRWAEDEYVRDEGRAEGRANVLVNNVENAQKNTGKSLDEVCKMLGTTVEEYERAKKVIDFREKREL